MIEQCTGAYVCLVALTTILSLIVKFIFREDSRTVVDEFRYFP